MSTILAAFKTSTRPVLARSLARPTPSCVGNALRYSSTMHDNDPEVLSKEKERNMSKKQHATSTPMYDSAPGWNESLASASEAAVKADQHNSSPKDLQARTVKYVKDRHHATDTPTFTEPPPYDEPGVSTRRMSHNGSAPVPEAAYTHDEVDGPLKNATVTETIEHKEDVITRKRVE